MPTTELKYKINWNVDNSDYPDEDIKRIEEKVLAYSREDKEISVSGGLGEYHYHFRVFPDTKTININYLAKFKFFNWKQNYRQDENIVFINAQEDFVSYLTLDFVGNMPMGTSLWLLQQSIEKYLKALLIKDGKFSIDDLRKREFGHNLAILFDEYRKVNPTSLLFSNEDYRILIFEVDSDGNNTGIRYSGGIHVNEPFTRIYIEICTILRYDFLGVEKFNESFPLGLGGRGDKVAEIIIQAHKNHQISNYFLNRFIRT